MHSRPHSSPLPPPVPSWKRYQWIACAAALLLAAGCRAAAPLESDVVAVLDRFYGGIKSGDRAAVMSVVAPDAVFVESGGLETRAEYEMNHLPADIEFEAQVTGKRTPFRVTFSGDTAWAIATTEYDGSFNGNPVSFVSAQLAVLTRESGAWQLRSIHWSSRRRPN
jgi:ketosteroid isomerase-like protein